MIKGVRWRCNFWLALVCQYAPFIWEPRRLLVWLCRERSIHFAVVKCRCHYLLRSVEKANFLNVIRQNSGDWCCYFWIESICHRVLLMWESHRLLFFAGAEVSSLSSQSVDVTTCSILLKYSQFSHCTVVKSASIRCYFARVSTSSWTRDLGVSSTFIRFLQENRCLLSVWFLRYQQKPNNHYEKSPL